MNHQKVCFSKLFLLCYNIIFEFGTEIYKSKKIEKYYLKIGNLRLVLRIPITNNKLPPVNAANGSIK